MKSRDAGASGKKQKKNKEFDKYYYYNKSVQSADVDVKFFRDTYEEINGKMPKVFREDFCGTFKLSCEWVKLNPNFSSIGMDLDPEPIAYGKENYLPSLLEDQAIRSILE